MGGKELQEQYKRLHNLCQLMPIILSNLVKSRFSIFFAFVFFFQTSKFGAIYIDNLNNKVNLV